MCGIIGYIGKETEKNLLAGLEKLEYRGYDSAGLCVKRRNNFYIEKTVGSVEKLKSKTKQKETFGIGIAHTRWATHGKITMLNTHPHFSADQNVAIVHNGIIENFEELKAELEKNGKSFYGETDSEVIAKLLSGKLTIKKIKKILEKIKGSYALAIISKKNNCIYFAKNKSPLYISLGKNCAFIASDPSVFINKCNSFFPVNDGEFGKITLKKAFFYNKNGKNIIKKSKNLKFDYTNAKKENYDFFMLKEINESQKVIENILQNYQNKKIIEKINKIKFFNYKRIYFIGCGTAYHAGLIGEKYFTKEFDKDVYTKKASEFPYENNLIDSETLCFFISQSGETIDTICAMEYAKKRKAKTIVITNVSYSTLATKADITFSICAGQEKAVASTKAYLGQCLVLYVLSKILKNKEWKEKLEDLKNNIFLQDDEKIKMLADELSKKDKLFFIGRGIDYITSLEASLKIKEISYIFTCVETSGELKHGPLALIDNKSIIIVTATEERLFKKTLNNAYETLSRGAKLILVTSLEVDQNIKCKFSHIYKVKKVDNELMPIQTIVFFQKLAYYISVKKSINPDKPRNLAKSVTVE